MNSVAPSVRNRRKILAVLAGGLVLGVGAAVTLAAWNDSEFATGTFKAGSFNLQGSLDGTTFTDHATAGTAAALSFSLPAGVIDHMTPGDTVYAPFWVRLAANTTSDASLAAASITHGALGNEAKFAYSVKAIAATDTCNSSATGTTIASGTSLSVLTPGTASALSKGSPTTSPGTAVQLCFTVTFDANAVAADQGKSGTATWEFKATSTN
jgi:predicted ribosomally synthesized peptide with SipW-like signal peptide